MRLPHEEGESSKILEDEAVKMVRTAIDNGVNYFDTAYNYHGGESEKFLGRVLSGGYRDKVKIATKLPSWKVEKKEDFHRFFDEQMERLDTDCIDFYLLHALQRDWWDRVYDLGFLDWAEKKLADGSIAHLGFSFHDKFPLFKRIVDAYDNWAMTLLMYNYMDVDFQAGTKGVEYAADNGMAVVVMEPLRGGLLAKEPPASVKRIFDESTVKRTPADWSLQWLWDRPEVSCVISGMSNMKQLKENVQSGCDSGIGTMTDHEKEVLKKVRAQYKTKKSIPCTDCRYCLPCPEQVAIPWILGYYNLSEMYESPKTARSHYAFLDEKNRGNRCTQCGQCVEKCPQHIDIPAELARIHEMLKPDK